MTKYVIHLYKINTPRRTFSKNKMQYSKREQMDIFVVKKGKDLSFRRQNFGNLKNYFFTKDSKVVKHLKIKVVASHLMPFIFDKFVIKNLHFYM